MLHFSANPKYAVSIQPFDLSCFFPFLASMKEGCHDHEKKMSGNCRLPLYTVDAEYNVIQIIPAKTTRRFKLFISSES